MMSTWNLTCIGYCRLKKVAAEVLTWNRNGCGDSDGAVGLSLAVLCVTSEMDDIFLCGKQKGSYFFLSMSYLVSSATYEYVKRRM